EFDTLVSHLTTVSVSGVAKALEEKHKPEQTEFQGVKVAFQLDPSGIVRIDKAEAVIQRKSQGVVESGGALGGAGGVLSCKLFARCFLNTTFFPAFVPPV
ncbi:hypothetical protein OESDEN_10756, partial [Oesophagostomum dentatum]